MPGLDVSCRVCGEEIESIWHLFFRCDTAARLWFTVAFGKKWESDPARSGLETLKLLIQCNTMMKDKLGDDVFINYAVGIMEQLWKNRNQKFFQGSQPSFRVLVNSTQQLVLDIGKFKTANSFSEGLRQERVKKRWQRPSDNVTKINVDAAFSEAGATVGIVARDERGSVLWMWRSKTQAGSAVEAEMIGVLMGVQLAKFRNHRRILVEGDNKAIMDSLVQRRNCPVWHCIPLYEQILSLSDGLSSCNFVWNHRDCNQVAHGLAKWALYSTVFGFCNLGNILSSVKDVIVRDTVME